ncbi:probable aquaporin TIP3-2 [Rutidosis leptorrhynchoides]|uniref:probable aquaporin TIP3-2 n=1 Tax=Rutidosis leptorrhynchoides TaxID=125765 RepID=UPI003A9943F2
MAMVGESGRREKRDGRHEEKEGRALLWKSDTEDNQSPLRKMLGLEEFLSPTVWRASIAEVFGTAVLVFALDTIVISSLETDTSTPNLVMSTIIAIIVTIFLLATFPVSGGHINPTVTFAALFCGLISVSRAAIYIFAQCIGAVLGALALKAVVNSSIERSSKLGGCHVTSIIQGADGSNIEIGLEMGQALWMEIICVFVFLFSSVWMAFDPRQVQRIGRVTVCFIVGIVLGLLVFISTTVTGTKGYSGAGLHPARCLGPAIVRGGHLWNGQWVFWVGPIIGCMLFGLYVMVVPRQHFHVIEK